MKIILLAFLLTGLGLWAQTPPPAPGTPGPARGPLPPGAVQAPPSVGTNAAAASPATRPAAPASAGQARPPGIPVPAPAGVAGPPVPRATPKPTATTKAPAPAVGDAASEETVPAGMIDFRLADLSQVLEVYADLVNRTILRPSTLPIPQINLTTHTALTKKEAIQALDAVLGMNGIAMVNVGDKFVKVVQTQNAGGVGQEMFKGAGNTLPELGQYVTYVMQVTNVRPSELSQALQPFASAVPNPILAIDDSQILVLRDFSENVKRMVEMVKKIDVAIPTDFVSEVIPIKYMVASDIASVLNSLSGSGGGGGVGAGTGAGRTGRTGRSGMGGMGSRMGMGSTGMGGMGMGGMGMGYSGTGMGGYSSMGEATPLTPAGYTPMAAATPVAPGANNSFTGRLRDIMSRAGGTGTGEIHVFGQTKIIADERTNSLLIYASKEDMTKIKDIINKLDIVLPQVLIESVIIEVDLNNSKNLGVSYQEAKGHGIGNYFNGIGGINNGNVLNQSTFGSGSGTNAAGSLPGGFSYLAHLGQDLDVSVTAAASDSHAKILQRPRIQTMNGVEASIFIGETTPYPTGSYYGGGAYGGYSSIQQMQVGVTLDVTPLINPEGLVVMQIAQQIDSVSGYVNIANIGNVPQTSSKTASTTVAVRDHETIILGGLIQTSKSDSYSGVPVLMSIPWLGNLFRSTTKTEDRSELIVLIRPTVLPTPEVAAMAARVEKNKMPGVRAAENEIQGDENKRIKKFELEFKGKEVLETQ
ncbi:MAG: secretin N-terminal domain-containing protein [Limisphaerales bacterium]